jgi:competence protein ComFC
VFRELFRGLTDLVYPACCILCKNNLGPLEKTHRLCFACQGQLQKNHPPFCRHCSRPLENPNHRICRNCQDTTLDFDQAWCAFLFNEPMQKLLHLFKYGHKTSLRHFFSDGILSFIKDYGLDLQNYDLIVPIPLHPTRLRERGYNQSALIADMIAAELNIPVDNNHLTRIRHTPNQARLSQKERWTNIQAAFKIKPHNNFRQKNILLVDDLYTTGSTVSQAAKTLKAAGAMKVTVLTIAIAAYCDK